MENKELIEPLQKENTPNEDYTKKMQSSKKRLNIKLDIIRKYAGESIVLFVHKYFYEVWREVNIVNRIIPILKKRLFAGKITKEEVEEILNTYKAIGIKYWNSLPPSSRKDETCNNWRRVNDSYREKEILAHRHNTIVMVPRNESVGVLAMIIKILNREIIGKNLDNIEEVDKLHRIKEDFREELKKANNEILTKYNIHLSSK